MRREELIDEISDVVNRQGGRVVIVGGPRTGKSSLAASIPGAVVYCGDPEDKVKDPLDSVEYVPKKHGEWSDASKYVAENFLTKPGPWVLDGVGSARALRKFRKSNPDSDPPCDMVVWLQNAPWKEHSRGQSSMTKGIGTVMSGIEKWLGDRLLRVRIDRKNEAA